MCRSLQLQAADLEVIAEAIGLGVAELVGTDRRLYSAATIQWTGIAVDEILQAETGLPVRLEADVRAAARAEAHFGAGAEFQSFIYVTVGTGISASLVNNRLPYVGARGLTGTFASNRVSIPQDSGELVTGPPLETFAAGPALAARLATTRCGFSGTSLDVIKLADRGDDLARDIVTSAGAAVGAAIGQLVNMLDPSAIVIGGGLGLIEGYYRKSLVNAMREHIWSFLHRDIPVISAKLGNDAGIIGAALAASSP
jgi:glucokinase